MSDRNSPHEEGSQEELLALLEQASFDVGIDCPECGLFFEADGHKCPDCGWINRLRAEGYI